MEVLLLQKVHHRHALKMNVHCFLWTSNYIHYSVGLKEIKHIQPEIENCDCET